MGRVQYLLSRSRFLWALLGIALSLSFLTYSGLTPEAYGEASIRLRAAVALDVDQTLLEEIKTKIQNTLNVHLDTFSFAILDDPAFFPNVRNIILQSCSLNPIALLIGGHPDLLQALREDYLFARGGSEFPSGFPVETLLGPVAVTFCSRDKDLARQVVAMFPPPPELRLLFIVSISEEQQQRLEALQERLEITLRADEVPVEVDPSDPESLNAAADQVKQLVFTSIVEEDPYDLLVGHPRELHERIQERFGLLLRGPGPSQDFGFVSITLVSRDVESASRFLDEVSGVKILTILTTSDIAETLRFNQAVSNAQSSLSKEIRVIETRLLERGPNALLALKEFLEFTFPPIDVLLGGDEGLHEALKEAGLLHQGPIAIEGLGPASIYRGSLDPVAARGFIQILQETE